MQPERQVRCEICISTKAEMGGAWLSSVHCEMVGLSPAMSVDLLLTIVWTVLCSITRYVNSIENSRSFSLILKMFEISYVPYFGYFISWRADMSTRDVKSGRIDNLNIYRLVRIATGISIVELAQKMELSSGYISEIETGKKRPSREYIERFSTVVGVKPSTLLFFEETQNIHRFNHQKMLLLILKKLCGEHDPMFDE